MTRSAFPKRAAGYWCGSRDPRHAKHAGVRSIFQKNGVFFQQATSLSCPWRLGRDVVEIQRAGLVEPRGHELPRHSAQPAEPSRIVGLELEQAVASQKCARNPGREQIAPAFILVGPAIDKLLEGMLRSWCAGRVCLQNFTRQVGYRPGDQFDCAHHSGKHLRLLRRDRARRAAERARPARAVDPRDGRTAERLVGPLARLAGAREGPHGDYLDQTMPVRLVTPWAGCVHSRDACNRGPNLSGLRSRPRTRVASIVMPAPHAEQARVVPIGDDRCCRRQARRDQRLACAAKSSGMPQRRSVR